MSLDAVIGAQRGNLFPWVPVCLGLGIALYFALPVEPGWGMLTLWVVLTLVLLRAIRHVTEAWGPLCLALALVCCGGTLAALRTQSVAAPVLSFRYYGPIEGRIVAYDRNLSDRPRITLDQVVLARTAPARTPARVRVSFDEDQVFTALTPGARVILTGHLSPPMGPAEPGGFDFRRHAWFEGLGAVGYSTAPILGLEPPDAGSFGLLLTQTRLRLAADIRARMPGQEGAFAAAVLTGDRSGLSRETLDTMRGSNLAHLLAISGLHMGLLTGFVFLVLRLGVAAIPYVSLRYDARKLAAGVALVGAAAYLALSGGSVATQRAFLMAAVMLGAVMLDRRMLTLRAVALAALVILVWRPESLLGAGFQMSFAATAALVWAFAMLRDRGLWQGVRWWKPIATLVMSSAVAGLATAPIGAAQFNQFAQFGLVANLVSVPVMGVLVMPAAVVAICLAPLGLTDAALWVMGLGCRWILFVAAEVTSWDGAVVPVVAPAPWVVPVLVSGALWVMLWQGRARWVGLTPMVLAFCGWSLATRPPILIADSGGLVGVLTAEGRLLSKPKGDGFTALSWLENDGDQRDQWAAAWTGRAVFEAETAGLRLRILTGTQAKKTADPCAGVDLVVLPKAVPSDCLVITRALLARSGALAVWPTAEGLRVVMAADRSGLRPWSPDPPPHDLPWRQPHPVQLAGKPQ